MEEVALQGAVRMGWAMLALGLVTRLVLILTLTSRISFEPSAYWANIALVDFFSTVGVLLMASGAATLMVVLHVRLTVRMKRVSGSMVAPATTREHAPED